MKKFWKVSACALAATFALPVFASCDKNKPSAAEVKMQKLEALGDAFGATLAESKAFDFGAEARVSTDTVIPGMGTTMVQQTVQAYKANSTLSLSDRGPELATDVAMQSFEGMLGQTQTAGESLAVKAYVLDGFAYVQSLENPLEYIKSPQTLDTVLSRDILGMYEDYTIGDIVNGVKDLMKKLESLEKLGVFDAIEEELFADTEYEDFDDFFTDVNIPELPNFSDVAEMSEFFAAGSELFAEFFHKEFTLVEEKGTTTITLDLQDNFDGMLTMVKELSNMKLGDLVNKGLASLSGDETLKWENLVKELKGKGSYTVRTVMNSLDSELYQASGFRLQEIKDLVLSQEFVYTLLERFLDGETVNEIRDFSIAEFVNDYGSYTIDRLLQEKTENPTMTVDGLLLKAQEMLTNMKVIDLLTFASGGQSVPSNGGVTASGMIASLINGIDVQAFNANLVVNVKDRKAISVEASYNVKVSVPMTIETAVGNVTMTASAYSYIKNFSPEAKMIALPTNATVVSVCYNCEMPVQEKDYCFTCKRTLCEDCHQYYSYNHY